MIVLSIGAISAQDVDDAIASSSDEIAIGDSDSVSNSVSGGVDVVTENPWNTTGELSYSIPSDAKTIKSADVYVNVYAGSAQNTYGANANITIATANGDAKYNEALWIEDGTTDGTVYTVNDHTTKCYSDYMIHYDVTDMLKDLNGSNLKINVDTFQMENKSFDGRIKLIALILGYDDGDDDVISYWINDDQLWTKGNVTVTFDTENIADFSDATLTNVVLSSGDGTYMINGEFLGDADSHVSGNYYQYNKWNVKDTVTANQKTDLIVKYAGTSAYGSIKNVLSILTVYNNNIVTDISITPEYTSVPSAFAGTNNTLTIKVNTNKAGKYSIKLLADGVEVNETETDLVSGNNTILLTDPTIRPIDESTVNGVENNKVNYTVELSYDAVVIDSKDVSLPVLYNGNLGYDLEYNMTGFESIDPITVNGNVVIDIKDVSSYLSASALNRTDVWAINLDSNSVITNGFVYVPYNWFNAKTYTEDINMFKATFNDVTVTPIAWYRDQGNLGNYGKYGYGVFVYDVSDLIKTGDNSFVLNKANLTPAVYPSALVYMYNTTGSRVSKTVYISNGADLLANSYNNAGRTVKSDSAITVDTSEIVDATLYVLAASAQVGEGNIVFNGEKFVDVWSGTSSTTDLFSADVTSLIEDNNSISFVATGSTILELPQIIVISKEITPSVIAIEKVNGSAVVSGVLKGVDNEPISNAVLSYTIGNVTSNITTDDNGAFVIQCQDNTKIDIRYDGNLNYSSAKASITLENLAPVKKATHIVVDAAFSRDANDYSAGERGANFTGYLLDEDDKPVVNRTVQVALNGPIYNLTTDENGAFNLQINLAAANIYTYAIAFLGDDTYNSAPLASSKLTVVQKSTSITASAKTFKSTAKTKKITVTLKTIKNKYDGKTYLKSGKAITLKINGVTYTAKTNAKGQATFSIKLTKKGTFTAAINFAGDKTYKASSKSIKITIK